MKGKKKRLGVKIFYLEWPLDTLAISLIFQALSRVARWLSNQKSQIWVNFGGP
jgi:hypothetical protein